MKYLTYLALFIVICSLFTSFAESKRSKSKLPFFRKKLPRQRSMSSSSSSSHSSNFGRSSFGGSSNFGRSNTWGGHSSSHNSFRDNENESGIQKKKELPKKPVSQMGYNGDRAKVTYDHSKVGPNVTYGPRGGQGGFVSTVSGPRYYGARPRFWGYYRTGFPVWLTSYAVVMRTLLECPAYKYNENSLLKLILADSIPRLCKKDICTPDSCIQTLNYCCTYVEPVTGRVVAAK